MIDTIVAAVMLHEDRQPAPSRGVSRFADSGHAVWDRTPLWIRQLSLCIRRHESIEAGHYKATNQAGSSAAGAYQMLSATWLGNAKWARWRDHYVARGYASAADAPAWVQDVVFIHSINHGGIKAWRGTGCPGTS